MNVTLGRRVITAISDEFMLANASGAAFSPESLAELALVAQTVDIVTKSWSSNPFVWSATGGSAAGVFSVEILDPATAGVLEIASANSPIIVAFTGSAAIDFTSFKCTYWNNLTATWDTTGTAFVSVDVDDTGASAIVRCGTVHLSDFSAVNGLGFLHLNLPNPIESFGKLSHAFTGRSLITTVATLVILGSCLVAWAVSGVIDNRKAEELGKLRKAHFVLFGQVAKGIGMGALHKGSEDKNRKKLQDLHDRLKVRGVVDGQLMAVGLHV